MSLLTNRSYAIRKELLKKTFEVYLKETGARHSTQWESRYWFCLYPNDSLGSSSGLSSMLRLDQSAVYGGRLMTTLFSIPIYRCVEEAEAVKELLNEILKNQTDRVSEVSCINIHITVNWATGRGALEETVYFGEKSEEQSSVEAQFELTGRE